MQLDFSKDYFELFSLPVSFDLDQGMLAARFQELQRLLHPDRFASASEQERRFSMQGATLVNEAFQTLKDPLTRATYLLSLQGVSLDNESDTQMDMAFLMQQMELREALDEVREKDDPLQATADVLDEIAVLSRSCFASLGTHLHAQAWSEARDWVRKLQFLRKLRESAVALELALEDEL
ncbi:MAG: co-chaperone HscB [Gammaproteobacteria bacterium]|nr:co-chaperone HscB [Gammaproteobacteria bacterium]